MLEEIYDRDENLTEEEYYDAIEYLFGDAYPDLSARELERRLSRMLDRLPVSYAESVLDTVGNIGKKIGTGALQFSGGHPDLVKAVATTAGTVVGGPLGAAAGSSVGNMLAQKAPKNPLKETGKVLSLMQNPQAQTAMARAALGVGNGTAPLTLNGYTNMIPVAMYLRAVISAAQAALRELDQKNIIPPATLSESMPYANDVDMQAEWLAEQLVE